MQKALIAILLMAATLLTAQTPSTETGYQYDAGTAAYLPMTKTEYSYNASDQVTEEIDYAYINDTWGPQSKDLHTYNASGQLTETVTQGFITNVWQNQNRTLYTYDQQGLQTEIRQESWDGQNWNPTYRVVYHNGTGVTLYREHQSYTGGSWVNSIREDLTYDDQSRQTLLMLYTWDGSQYVISSRTATAWNDQNQMVSETIDIHPSGQWDSFQKLERSYDEQHRLTIYMESFYQNGTWMPNMRSTNQYDGSSTDLLFIWFENHVNTGDPSTEWVPSWKYEYSYEGRTAVEEDNAGVTSFRLEHNYPNPFNPSTTIVFHLPETCSVTVDVFNTSGQQVAILAQGVLAAGQHSRQFEAADLPTGTYFCRLKTASGIFIRKMLYLK